MNWGEFSPADFDARQADKRALRAAKTAAEAGQAGLFFVATPERERAQQQPAEMDGQTDLFSEEN